MISEHLDTFLAQVEAHTGTALPQFVQDEFDAFLECGILAHGFFRLRCPNARTRKRGQIYLFRLHGKGIENRSRGRTSKIPLMQRELPGK